jgi:hypothetical protein
MKTLRLASLRAQIFFKRKKEKKESHLSSGRFQISQFFRKNTTRLFLNPSWFARWDCFISLRFIRNGCEGGDFL